jgi:ribosomal protein L9|tara:strand:- start:250 stop:696 length:447 start_codon:yes stop_codon:yes gene_type:complete
MQLILLETLNKLGKAGEVVSVRDGYAKNFLIPKQKAIIANKKNLENLTTKMSQINENNEKKTKEANDIKSKLNEKLLKIKMEANEDGNLYGNVTHKQIIKLINEEFSINLTPENIILGNLRVLGEHVITIRLYDNISLTLTLVIEKKD